MSDDLFAQQLDGMTILRAEVGSTGHGVTHATNDIDEIAVFIPAPRQILGLSETETFIYRPGRGPHEPSGPGDLDRTYHSLRKFVRLLAKGNPSILYTLFAPVKFINDAGVELVNLRGNFRHDGTRNAYLGYMESQRQRITGERGSAGRIRRSPEGGGEVDWKYAMHMVRLGLQGYEYLATGSISCPTVKREELMEIRAGEWPLDRVVSWAEALEDEIKQLTLPEPTRSDWDTWLARRHLKAWES